jgi:hypothetical protein
MGEKNLLSIDTGNLKKGISLRVSKKTKNLIDALDPAQKKIMNHEIRQAIARVLHQAAFRAEDYLNDEDDDD